MHLFFALTAITLAASQPSGELLNRIVAVVNDDVILLDEVDEATSPLLKRLPADLPAAELAQRKARLRRQVLDSLVADKLLEQQVKILNLEVSPRELDKIIDNMRAQNNMTEAQFKAALAGQGLSMDAYREGMRKQLLKMKIINLKVRSKVKVSDQDIKGRYQQQRADAARDVRYRVRHMVFLVPEGASADVDAAAKKRAIDARARVLTGEDFASLATQLSEGPSAPKGGDLGYFKPGDMVPAFESAALALKINQVSAPVRTPFGWHIIQMVDKKQGELGSIKEVKDSLREKLYQEEVEVAFQRYVQTLKKEAYIDLRLDDSFAATSEL